MIDRNSSLVRKLAVGVAVLGLAATSVLAADDAAVAEKMRHKKHQEMMESGRTTHEEAWQATNEKPSAEQAQKVKDDAAKHKEMMKSGKTTHEEAWSATNKKVSPAEARKMREKAKKHQELMNQGKPHEQAWQATDADQSSK